MKEIRIGRHKLRRYLIWTFWLGLLFTVGFTWYYIERRIPRRLSVVVRQQEEFHLELPFDVTLQSESEEVVLGTPSKIPADQIRLKVDEPLSLYAKQQGSYRLGVRLFGTIQLREIEVDVVDVRYAVPCGVPAGIYLRSNGVMVIGTGRIRSKDGQELEPAYGILQSGDYIEAINGEPLQDKEALISCLNHCGAGEAVLKVRRDGKELEIRMNPVQAEDGNYKLGAWVRDDTQGIGTLTYIDSNGNFGALGHGISDSDTGQVVETQDGALYETEILGIEKGTAGHPGVMAGVIYYGPGTQLGTITANTEVGIFGTANERMKKAVTTAPAEIGYRQDVHNS